MKKIKHVFLMVISCLTVANALAQKGKGIEPQIKFGKLSDAETKMTVYDKDPEAAAVIFFEKAHLDYEMSRETGWNGRFTMHARTKILKKEGYSWANIVIPFHQDVVVEDLNAACYNLEGSRWVETKLNPNNIVTERLSKTWYSKKFTIPQVREGSIIEYTYTLFTEKGGYLPQNWDFQNKIPTLWSEYRVNLPYHWRAMPTLQGIVNQPLAIHKDTLEERKDGYGLHENTWQNRILHWAQKEVPALKSEPMMSSIYNYKSRVTLQEVRFYKPKSNREQAKMTTKDLLVDVWKQWGQNLLDHEHFGDILKHKATEETVKSLIEGLTTDKEKVLAIYKHIGTTYEDDNDDALYFEQPFKDFLKKHKGSPTELNLLAINMLRKAGVEVFPVIMSTRSHGRLDTGYLPIRERFNRVIAYLPKWDEKEPFLLDVTSYPNPLGLLPFEDLNGEGFVVRSPNAWVPLKNRIQTKKLLFNTLKLNENGELSGAIAVTATGYDASESRYYFHKDGAEKYANTLLKDLLVDGKLEEHSFENTERWDEKYLKGSFKIKTSAFVTKTDSQMYISPLLFWAEKENIFKNPERQFDIDYGYSRENSYILNLTIPSGYKVESLPKSTKINLDKGNFTFTYIVESAGNELKINVKWNIKKTIFVPEEYPSLRTTYETILNKMAEQIVLSKI